MLGKVGRSCRSKKLWYFAGACLNSTERTTVYLVIFTIWLGRMISLSWMTSSTRFLTRCLIWGFWETFYAGAVERLVLFFFFDIGGFKTSDRYLSVFETAIPGYFCRLVGRKILKVQGAGDGLFSSSVLRPYSGVAPSYPILRTWKDFRTIVNKCLQW